MLHEEKKAAKIVEKLTVFFLGAGATKMSSSMKREQGKMYITFQSNYAPECQHRLEAMEDFLCIPKNDGMEDIYWELAGTGDPGETSELLLIGMMVDEAEVIKKADEVEIKLSKAL